jgi:multiple sugar transport system ATP-binding protein
MNGKVRRANGSAHVEVPGGVRWPLPSGPGANDQAVAYGIRPGDLRLDSANAAGAVPAEIIVVEPTGAETELLIQAGNDQLILVTHGRPNVNPGDRVGLSIDPAKVHVFDQGTGARLSA